MIFRIKTTKKMRIKARRYIMFATTCYSASLEYENRGLLTDALICRKSGDHFLKKAYRLNGYFRLIDQINALDISEEVRTCILS